MTGKYNKQSEVFTITIYSNSVETTKAYQVFEVIKFMKKEFEDDINNLETLGFLDNPTYLTNGKVDYSKILSDIDNYPNLLNKIYRNV